MQRKTTCGRYRRAAWLGERVAALRTVGGVSSLVLLEPHGKKMREAQTLYQTPDQVEAVDLAVAPDDKRIALVVKHAGTWQVLEFDAADGAPRVLLNYDAPLHEIHYTSGGDALEFLAVKDNIYDLWRYKFGSNEMSRLSHTYTAVLGHSGVAQDGSVVLAVLASHGTELRRMKTTAPLQQVKLDSNSDVVLRGDPPPASAQLGKARNYHAFYSAYPRTWLPSLLLDRGLTAIGASTFGSDALGWHNYTANLMWETSQHEPIGSLAYSYLGEHFFSVSRNLRARQWTGSSGNETTTVFDRTTDAQWASMLPWLRLERQVYAGIGAAVKTTNRVQVPNLTTRTQDARLGATFLRYDTRNSNWYADGYNRGNLSTLLYESYRPFKSFYDGYVTRFDTRQLVPIGDSVLTARWTEARAHGNTEPFQLGGAMEYDLTQAPMLNQRDLPLRGYIGSETALRGQNVRNLGIEWRTPLADIDRATMSPPVGIDRLSGSVFMDAGSVWDNGYARSRYYRGVGVELQGEIRLLYGLPVPLRLGIAHGLDGPRGTHAYLQLGQAF
jgi:hypothetical protein